MRLPKKLEELIFNEMGAIYGVSDKVYFNLYSDEDDAKMYLGTYFPRSYAEGYNVFKNLLSNEIIRKNFEKQDQLYMLDIGAGAGGYSFGVVQAIREKLKQKDIKIHILMIEFNEKFCEQQQMIHEKFIDDKVIIYQDKTCFTQGLNMFESQMHGPIKNFESKFDTDKFDIIVCSKFASEFFQKKDIKTSSRCKPYNCDEPYLKILETCEAYLNPHGLLVLSDVPILLRTLENETIWVSEIMNTDTINYFKDSSHELRLVMPLCCALLNTKCNDYSKCFHNKCYDIMHPKGKNMPDIKQWKGVICKVFMFGNYSERILQMHKVQKRYMIADWNSKYGIRKWRYCEKGKYIEKDSLLPEAKDPYVL